jgi:hypothetical protein
VGAVVSAAESQQGPLHDRFNREGRFPFGAWLMQAFRQMTTRLAEGVGCDGVGRVGELRRDLTWRRSEQFDAVYFGRQLVPLGHRLLGIVLICENYLAAARTNSICLLARPPSLDPHRCARVGPGRSGFHCVARSEILQQ